MTDRLVTATGLGRRRLLGALGGLGLVTIGFLSLAHCVGRRPPPPHRFFLSNSDQLRSVLSDALAGDEIVLSGGVYTGEFVVSRAGTAAHPIVVRAAVAGEAVLTGRFVLAGAFGVLSGLAGREDARVLVQGADCRVLRCSFTAVQPGTAGVVRLDRGAHRAEVAYNRIEEWFGRGIIIRGGTDMARDCHIHHNHLKDGSSDGPGTGGAAILMGEGPGDTLRQCRALVEYNLVEQHQTGAGAIECKSGHNVVRFNTLKDSTSRLETRNGVFNDFIGNSSLNAGGPIIWGRDCRVIGNYHDGVRTGSWFSMGAGRGNGTLDQYVSGAISAGSYPAAETCLFAGNIGPLTFAQGSSSASLQPTGCRIENHTGSFSNGAATATTGSPDTPASVAVPPYVILSPNQVGPTAGPASD